MGGWVLGGCACGSAHAEHVSSARRGACVWWARVRASTCSRQPAAAAAASPEWVRCGRPPAWVLTRARLKPVRPVVVTEIGIARRARVHARREIARARRASRTAHARAHVHATHTHTNAPASRETRNQIRSDQVTRKQLSNISSSNCLSNVRDGITDTHTTGPYRSNPSNCLFSKFFLISRRQSSPPPGQPRKLTTPME